MLFMAVVGFIAWSADAILIFPSLGPTAYLLAYDKGVSYSAGVVIGGHCCGIAGGLVSYTLVVEPYILSGLIDAFSVAGGWLAMGAVISLGITVFLMLLFQVSHPPACATTLIISLGILPAWGDSIVILAGVTVLYLCYRVYHRLARGTNEP